MSDSSTIQWHSMDHRVESRESGETNDEFMRHHDERHLPEMMHQLDADMDAHGVSRWGLSLDALEA